MEDFLENILLNYKNCLSELYKISAVDHTNSLKNQKLKYYRDVIRFTLINCCNMPDGDLPTQYIHDLLEEIENHSEKEYFDLPATKMKKFI